MKCGSMDGSGISAWKHKEKQEYEMNNDVTPAYAPGRKRT